MLLGISAAFLVLAVSAYIYYRQKWGWHKSPPGPWGVPIVGYLPFLDNEKPFMEQVNDLGRKYGDVFTLKLGKFQVLVLQSHDAIVDGFRLGEMAGRAETWSMQVLLEQGQTALMWQEGEKWADNRRIASRGLKIWGTSGGRVKLSELLDIATSYLMNKIDSTKEQPLDTTYLFSGYTFAFLKVACYGGKFEPEGKFATDLTNFMTYDMLDINPGIWSEYIPFAQRFNKEKIKAGARSVELLTALIRGEPATEGFEGMAHEVLRTIGKMDGKGVHEDSTEVVAEALVGGVFDILDTFRYFLLYLATEQKVLMELQARLDKLAATFSHPSGPDFWDAVANEPYLQAVVWEGIRCGTPTNGLPHKATTDVHFRGFFIPKGTMILGNQRASNNDPFLFTEPDRFNPDRFILDSGFFDRESASKVLSFSTGKRRCLGETLAVNFMAVTVAMVAMHYDVEVTSGFDALDNLFFTNFSCSPNDHEISFIPRKK